jgi:uncharacterized protein
MLRKPYRENLSEQEPITLLEHQAFFLGVVSIPCGKNWVVRAVIRKGDELMKRPLEEVVETLSKSKKGLFEQYKIKELGIFGSLVRGEEKMRSDVDVLVSFNEIPDLLTFIELERKLHRLLRKKVDLVRKEAVRPVIKERILREVRYI